MTVAKALGNGVPIGACVAAGDAAGVLTPGTHGSTFGGNPLACAAALAVLNTIENEKLVERAATLGQHLFDGFKARLAEQPMVKEIRGMGLLIGIELNEACPELVAAALEKGMLINVTANTVIRLLPPLILSDAQAQQVIDTVSDLINDFAACKAEDVA
jgi:acetylornithine aminotransferase